jgi:hypothetical protein
LAIDIVFSGGLGCSSSRIENQAPDGVSQMADPVLASLASWRRASHAATARGQQRELA